MFFDSSDPSQIDTGHQNEWADIEMPDGAVKKCEDPRGPILVTSGLDTRCLFLLIGRLLEQQTDDKNALKPKMLKIPG